MKDLVQGWIKELVGGGVRLCRSRVVMQVIRGLPRDVELVKSWIEPAIMNVVDALLLVTGQSSAQEQKGP